MLRTIVEGEPGIFPDPVARIMRGIGGIFRRRSPADEPPTPGPADEPPATDPGAVDEEPPASDEPGQRRGHPGETT